ncbi:hypothetical protein [Barnesiella sp. An22]|uniref:hypothetical protein n=1 Tax=Barnesiella sp. An22 TaxID=1965590 RepID=UPI000B39257E|nr:hypothetical protein [Barnesiella sp. An22]OUO97831.1 hypothetical protein B5F38_08855 [Barnesiella sp. An22]
MDNNDSFLQFLRQNPQSIFIEAEAREERIANFISSYNSKYHRNISISSQGIRKLGDVDKWGVELRVYFNNKNNLSAYWQDRMYKNKVYRADEFKYRIDDNSLVNFLFEHGYILGHN